MSTKVPITTSTDIASNRSNSSRKRQPNSVSRSRRHNRKSVSGEGFATRTLSEFGREPLLLFLKDQLNAGHPPSALASTHFSVNQDSHQNPHYWAQARRETIARIGNNRRNHMPFCARMGMCGELRTYKSIASMENVR